MNKSILQGDDQEKLKTYVDGKFEAWKKKPLYKYRKDARDDYCLGYYRAASTTPNPITRRANNQVVADRYSFIFQDPFPYQKAKEKEEVPTHKMEWGEALRAKKADLRRRQKFLDQLQEWKANQDFQGGPDFFEELKTQMDFFKKGVCDPSQFTLEHGSVLMHEITSTHSVSDREASASFDAMFGIKQHIDAEFSYFNPRLGSVVAKLNETFKAGAWGSGEASAKLKALGFDLDVQAAIAFGAEFDVSGNCAWKKGQVGLELAGNCTLFAGAQGNFAASLSADARKGINAAISAGAFVGVSANVGGTFNFTYGDAELVSTSATAGVSFGVGGNFSANLSVPIFGPTTIGFSTSVAVGLGVQTSVATSVDFSEIALATNAQFRKVIYIPTLLQGYKMDLINQDAKNKHYLNKCIDAMSGEVKELQEEIEGLEQTSDERQSLLV